MKVVTDFSEVETRPEYDDECPITLDNFQSIVFPYNFRPDWKQCQVKSREEKKHLCGNKHWEGWLGKTKDGPEGLIGKDCGMQYFNAHNVFRSEVDRIDKALALAQRVEALQGMLIDRPKYEARIAVARELLNRLKTDLTYLTGKLTAPIKKRLDGMAKGDSKVLQGRFCHVEYELLKDKNGKEVQKPVYSYYNSPIGTVAGAKIQEQIFVVMKHMTTLRVAERTLIEASAEASKSFEQLGHWTDALNGVDDAEKDLDYADKTLKAYAHPDNLKLQIFMTEQPSSQHAMASLAIDFAGALWKVIDPQELIQQYRAEIMRKNMGRTFTVH